MIRRWICCRRSRGETARRDASLPHDDRCGSFLWRARVPAGRWDMTSDPSNSLPARSRPAHPPVRELGNRSIIVFVTVCTSGRQPVLANPVIHGLLRESWERAGHWLVGRYVVMPDHIHLFCAPGKIHQSPLDPGYPIGSGWSRFPRVAAYGRKTIGILSCADTRATRRNGPTCMIIPSEPDWSPRPTHGHIGVS
jgi:hypothetical protein